MIEGHSRPSRRWPWLVLAALLVLLMMAVAFTTVTQAISQANLISGRVTDPDGGLPPAGTTVRLVSPPDAVHGSAAVDASGNFALGPVPNGNYVLQAAPPPGSGLTPSLPRPVLMIGSAIDVGVLPLTFPSITGTVFAPAGTTPVSATVHVEIHGHRIQSAFAPGGSFLLGGLPPGTYSLQAHRVTDDPYWNSQPKSVTVTAGIVHQVDLVLRPANVAGIVTDASGAPIAGASAHVMGISAYVHRSDASSRSGYFAIGDLIDDKYLLVAQPPPQSSGLSISSVLTFTVPPAFNDMGSIALRGAPKEVSGKVESNSRVPVENALVVAHRLGNPAQDQALTDANGHYLLKLSGGVWSLTVRNTPSSNPSAWLYPHPPQLVHFDPDYRPESKTIDFTVLTADAHVTGLVKMPDGITAPTFSVTVGLRNSEGIGRHELLSPGESAFDLQVPHGNYILSLHPHDPSFAAPAPLRVYAPVSGTIDVGILTLLDRDATIGGAVLDEEGHGVGGIPVIGWSRDHIGAQTHTSPDGSYVLSVIAGDWLIEPQVPPDIPYIYAGGPASVTIGSMEHVSGIDFTLTGASNVVNGQLVDGAGNPVRAAGWAAAADDNGRVNGAPIQGGSFAIYLPDGSYQVGVHLLPGSGWLAGAPQPVAVSGGETLTLAVPLMAQDATIMAALWDPRQEVVPIGVNGHVAGHNPFASVNSAIDPSNGTAKLGVSAGLWHVDYGVDSASGYVPLDHHKVIPLQSGQTLGVALPVAEKDGFIQGVVFKPDGQPLPGAVVAADGLGPGIGQITLRTHADLNGLFRLAVPHGVYVLRAAQVRDSGWLNPIVVPVTVPAGGSVTGVRLHFRASDVTLSGVTNIAGNPPVDGRVHIWAYNADGASAHTVVPLGDRYQLGLLSNSRWLVGAALETGDSFYVMRTTVHMGTSDVVEDLVLHGPFAKPGPVVTTFDAAEPHRVALADGTELFIPAGAMPVSGTVTLHITPIATLPHQHHARLYKYGYAFIATDDSGTPITSNFNQNVIIRFSYDESELRRLGLHEAHLKPAYYSTSSESWTVPESYVVDTGHDLVTMQIDHFTDFSLLNSATSQVYLPALFR